MQIHSRIVTHKSHYLMAYIIIFLLLVTVKLLYRNTIININNKSMYLIMSYFVISISSKKTQKKLNELQKH